jgi:hypothetical protein
MDVWLLPNVQVVFVPRLMGVSKSLASHERMNKSHAIQK